MRNIGFIYIILTSLLLNSCAIQVPPGGGEKDVIPPKLLKAEPPNFSIGFTGHDFKLDFDEYITLSDLGNQLIVSPLLKNAPEVHVRKKSLLVHISDTLLENTTYTINFGQGIADNNEGNKLDNFQYVFSTGSVIDSSEIKGKIIRAFDLKPEKGALALLYKGNSDSLPLLERPLYFAQANDSGEFNVRNITPGNYKIIGLKDTDGNYIYTPVLEGIAFKGELVPSNSDKINLTIFNEAPKLTLQKAYSEYSGKVVLAFTAPADTVKIRFLSDTSILKIYSIQYSKLKDSISIWYENLNADTLSFSFVNAELNDTIVTRLFKGIKENRGKKSVELIISDGNRQPTVQDLYLPFFFNSNHPLVSASFEKAVFMEDSISVQPQFEFLDSLHMHFQLKFPWKSKRKYSLYLPSSIFKDFYGLYNDSMNFSFIAHSETDYGSLKLNLIGATGIPTIIQLVDESGATVFREFSSEQDTAYLFSNLDARVYKIKLIYDKNKNGKWDTGNYLNKIQPEEVEFYKEKITVRSNWDVDVTVKSDFTIK